MANLHRKRPHRMLDLIKYQGHIVEGNLPGWHFAGMHDITVIAEHSGGLQGTSGQYAPRRVSAAYCPMASG